MKNDYAIAFDTPIGKSTTIAGFTANTAKVRWRTPASASRPPVPANNLGSITYPGYVYPPILPGLTTAGLGLDRTGKQDDLQFFGYETLALWQNRVQLPAQHQCARPRHHRNSGFPPPLRRRLSRLGRNQ